MATPRSGLGVLAAPEQPSPEDRRVIPPGIALQPLRGYLFKQDHDNTKTWRRRYFAVYDDRMFYYAGEDDWARCRDRAADSAVKGVLHIVGSTIYVINIETTPQSEGGPRQALHGFTLTVAKEGRLRSIVLAAETAVARDYWVRAMIKSSRYARQVAHAAAMVNGLAIPPGVRYGDPELNEATTHLASNQQASFLEGERTLMYLYTGHSTKRRPVDRYARCVLMTSQRLLRVHGRTVLVDLMLSDLARVVYYGPETSVVDQGLSLLVARRPMAQFRHGASPNSAGSNGAGAQSASASAAASAASAAAAAAAASGAAEGEGDVADGYLNTTLRSYRLVAEHHSGARSELLLTGQLAVDLFFASVVARVTAFRWWIAREFTTTLNYRRHLWFRLVDTALRNQVVITPEDWRSLLVRMGSSQHLLAALLFKNAQGKVVGRRGGDGFNAFAEGVLSQDLDSACDYFWNTDAFFPVVRSARGVGVLDSRPLSLVWQSQASAKSFELFVNEFTDLPSQHWMWDEKDRVYPVALASVVLPRHAATEAAARAPLDQGIVSKPGTVGATAAAAAVNAIGAEVTEEVWENQRYYLYFKWSSNLLPFDRYSWSDDSGSKELSLRAIERNIPAGWRWITDSWQLHTTADTKDGWYYSTAFGPGLKGWAPTRSNVSYVVRKRRWVRRRVCVSLDDKPAGSAAGAVSTRHVGPHSGATQRPRSNSVSILAGLDNLNASAGDADGDGDGEPVGGHGAGHAKRGATRYEYAFENERWYPGGYSKKLMPGDRPSWSTEDGNTRVDRNNVRLPTGFVWVDDWQVDPTFGGDADHWRYAVNFPWPYFDEDSVLAFVRRRRWRRACRPQADSLNVVGYPAWVMDTPLVLDEESRLHARLLPAVAVAGIGYVNQGDLVLNVNMQDRNHLPGEPGAAVTAERLHQQLIAMQADMARGGKRRAQGKKSRNALSAMAHKIASLASLASEKSRSPRYGSTGGGAAAAATPGTLTPAALRQASRGSIALGAADATGSAAELMDYAARPGSSVSLAAPSEVAGPLQRWVLKSRADMYLDHAVMPLFAQLELAALEDLKVAANVAAANELARCCPTVAAARDTVFAVQAAVASEKRRFDAGAAAASSAAVAAAQAAAVPVSSVDAAALASSGRSGLKPKNAGKPGHGAVGTDAQSLAPQSPPFSPFAGSVSSPPCPLSGAGARAKLSGTELVRAANAGPLSFDVNTLPDSALATQPVSSRSVSLARSATDPALSPVSGYSDNSVNSSKNSRNNDSYTNLPRDALPSPGRGAQSFYANAHASSIPASSSSSSLSSSSLPHTEAPPGSAVRAATRVGSVGAGAGTPAALLSPTAQMALPSSAFERAIRSDTSGAAQGGKASRGRGSKSGAGGFAEQSLRFNTYFTASTAGSAALRSPLEPPREVDVSMFTAAHTGGIDPLKLPLRFVPVALTTFAKLWSTSDVRDGPTFSVWRAAAPPGFAVLGDIISPSAKMCEVEYPVLLCDRADLLPPLGFSLRFVLNEPGVEALMIFEMVPPLGYRALGLVASKGKAPEPSVFRCVPDYLCVAFQQDLEGVSPYATSDGGAASKRATADGEDEARSAAAGAAAAAAAKKKAVRTPGSGLVPRTPSAAAASAAPKPVASMGKTKAVSVWGGLNELSDFSSSDSNDDSGTKSSKPKATSKKQSTAFTFDKEEIEMQPPRRAAGNAAVSNTALAPPALSKRNSVMFGVARGTRSDGVEERAIAARAAELEAEAAKLEEQAAALRKKEEAAAAKAAAAGKVAISAKNSVRLLESASSSASTARGGDDSKDGSDGDQYQVSARAPVSPPPGLAAAAASNGLPALPVLRSDAAGQPTQSFLMETRAYSLRLLALELRQNSAVATGTDIKPKPGATPGNKDSGRARGRDTVAVVSSSEDNNDDDDDDVASDVDDDADDDAAGFGKGKGKGKGKKKPSGKGEKAGAAKGDADAAKGKGKRGSLADRKGVRFLDESTPEHTSRRLAAADGAAVTAESSSAVAPASLVNETALPASCLPLPAERLPTAASVHMLIRAYLRQMRNEDMADMDDSDGEPAGEPGASVSKSLLSGAGAGAASARVSVLGSPGSGLSRSTSIVVRGLDDNEDEDDEEDDLDSDDDAELGERTAVQVRALQKYHDSFILPYSTYLCTFYEI